VKHPVIVKLGVARRRELLNNESFVALGESAQSELLDRVKGMREELDYRDQSDRFNDPRRRDKDASALARSLATVLKIVDPHKPNARLGAISRDLIYSLSDLHRGSISKAIRELQTFNVKARRIEEAIKRIQRTPPGDDLQQRTRRANREALGLHWLLTSFRVGVSRTAGDARPNPGLVLMGLLADPPTSPEVMRKRLRR
jgi:hypothetical protein